MKITFNENLLKNIAQLLCSPYYLGLVVKEYIKKYPQEKELYAYIKEVKNIDEVSFADFMLIMVNKIKIEEDNNIWFKNVINAICGRDQSSYYYKNFIKLLTQIEKENNIDISEIARLNGNIKYYKNFIKSKPENIKVENVILWLNEFNKNIYHWKEQTKKDVLYLVDLVVSINNNSDNDKIIEIFLPILESIYKKENKSLILDTIEKIVNNFPSDQQGSIIISKNEENIFNEEESILYTYKCNFDKKKLKNYVGNNEKKIDIMYNSIIRIIQNYIKEKTNQNNDSYGLVYVSTNENIIQEIKYLINEFLEYKNMLFSGSYLVDDKNSYGKYLEETSISIKQQIELENKVPNKDNIIKKKKI